MSITVARPPAAAAGQRAGRAGAMSTLVALDTLLTVDLLRAFPALVATRVDTADRLPLAFQVSVLVVPFLGAATVLVRARLGDARRLLLWSGILLGGARIGAQLVHGDLGAVVAGAGLLGGLIALGILAMIGLPLFGGGVVAGVGLGAALRIGLGSRDLIWIDHIAAGAAVAAAAAWYLLLLWRRTRRGVDLLGRVRVAALPLLSLGPALLLGAFVLTSLGWVGSATGLGWFGASVVIGAATAAGVGAAAWTAAAPSGWSRVLGLVGAAAVGSLSLAHATPSLLWAGPVVAAQAGLGALLTAASSRGVRSGPVSSPALVVACAPLFLLATVVALDGRGLLGFTVRPSAAVGASGVVVLIAGLTAIGQQAPPAHHPGWRHLPSVVGVFVLPAALLLVGLPLLARAGGGAAVGDARELRVVTYNVGLGFTDRGDLNVEEVAAVLASLRPDVLALQEVPRGFLPTAGIDMIGWLQHALGLPHVAFQPSAPGALHGNAVLSRHPIDSVEVRSFPRRGTALPRGALAATIDVPTGDDVVVITSHFPPGGSLADRASRIDTLLALWADRPRTIVGLDANAGPSSWTMGLLRDGGLLVADSDAPTYPASSPRAQIDFVLHSDDLVPVSLDATPSRASDHLPVLAVLRPADLV